MSRSEYEEDLHAELGYRTAGRRELAQREWFSLRGEAGEVAPNPKAFKKLVAVLRTKKWQKENPEKTRANNNRYALKPENLRRSIAGQRRRRRERFVATAQVIVCAECRVEFCEARPRGGLPRKFCSDLCGARNVQLGQRRKAGRRAICCRVCGEPGHNARRHRP